jgi:phytol kinase
MIDVVSTLAIILMVLLINEHLWRKKIIRGEAARKFIHILTGVFVAFWPLYLSWAQIKFLALGAVLFFLAARYTRVFHGIYEVKRRSWGDLIGPGTIVVLAWLEPSVWVFTAAVLHIALADGFAAVIGAKYGRTRLHKIFGNTKSLVGTLTFWLISFAILFAGANFSDIGLTGLTLPLLLWLSAGAAYVENIAPYGFDNFLVPMLIYVVLEPLQAIS